MCSDLLDKLTEVRDDCRLSRWSPQYGIEFIILVNLFSSGEATVKRIIEALNLLSLVDKARAPQCLQVAKEIIGLQGGIHGDETESIYLIDLQRALSKILSKDAAALIQKAVDNATDHFGTTATRIRYAAVRLEDVDGSFNDPEFSSSLLLQPPVVNTVHQASASTVAPEMAPPRATSSTIRSETIENDWQKLESDADFYNKLRNWN